MKCQRKIEFTDQEPDDIDIIAFAHFLAQVYGTPKRALALMIRTMPEYDIWYRRVAWCRHCGAYVPTMHLAQEPKGKARFVNHRQATSPEKDCVNSQVVTTEGLNEPEFPEPSPQELRQLLKATQPQGETP